MACDTENPPAADLSSMRPATHLIAVNPAAAPTLEHVTPENVTRLAMDRLDTFMSFESAVLRGDDPDAIHDMRVASRRLQQALDLLYPKPRPRTIARLRKRLRRARRGLSVLRNCDVLVALVEKRLRRTRKNGRAVAWKATQDLLTEQRVRELRKAHKRLAKIRLDRFYLDLRGALQEYAVAAAGDEALREEFPARVQANLLETWQGFEDSTDAAILDPNLGHPARIAAKKFRYLVEVLDACGVSGAHGVLRWLKSIQTALGDWHDLVVLENALIETAAQPNLIRKDPDVVRTLLGLIEKTRRNATEFLNHFLELAAPEARQSADGWVKQVRTSGELPATA